MNASNQTVFSPAEAVACLLDGRPRVPVVPEATAFAPANIALVKYWGKRDARLNLPVTSSLSMSLGRLGSSLILRPCDAGDWVSLNGKALSPDSAFVQRASAFLDLFRPSRDMGFEVVANNTIPTAAGFASSASGFAAMVKALDRLFGWQLDPRAQSILARLGSGSASRSVFDGFVEWHAGLAPNGMDSFAEPLAVTWPELRIGLVVVTSAEKGISSRAAMQRTVANSPLYPLWPDVVARDLAEIKEAIAERDFTRTGAVAERNALTMHATMLAASPPVLYWVPESVRMMQKIWKLREAGLPVYFTMDAGPNVKVLYPAAQESDVTDAFDDVQFVRAGD
ncbi:MAG: diphosphomevalonate decarboxylase [Verrucomicrobia bacterium]|nr:diphosphomevalonate decarboxylase [Verrucomicrobiota bacterium]